MVPTKEAGLQNHAAGARKAHAFQPQAPALPMNSGGTEGGGGKFALGFVLAAVSLYFFFDSVQVSTDGAGWTLGAMRGGGRSGVHPFP